MKRIIGANHGGRHQAVGEWLDVALGNAEAAILLVQQEGLEKQALYMIQQSMECAAKGACLNAGLSHSDLKKIGHGNLHLIVRLHDTILRETRITPFIDQILASARGERQAPGTEAQIQNLNILTTPQKMSKHLSSAQKERVKQFYESALTVPPVEIAAMLELLSNMEQMRESWRAVIAHITANDIALNQPSDNDISSSLIQQVAEQVNLRLVQMGKGAEQTEAGENLIQRFIKIQKNTQNQRQMKSDLDKMNWNINFTEQHTKILLMVLLDIPLAFTGMLVVGSLVWAHEAYIRYPAAPDSPISFAEAAKERNGQRQLGTGHYSTDVGAIKHVQELAHLAKKISVSLKETHELGLLYGSQQWGIG